MLIAVVLSSNLKAEAAAQRLAHLPHEVIQFDGPDAIAQSDRLADIEVLFSALVPPKPEVIEKMPKLRWVFSYSAGVEHYPLSHLKEQGILLTNTSGIHRSNIAEQVFGAMILFSRNLLTAMKYKEAKKWEWYPLSELIGKELLIIGAGQIGSEIARKAKAFDMKVTGVRTQAGELPDHYDDVVATADLLKALPGKDYVVLVVPATEATRDMMNREAFAAMSQGAVFINVGRGSTVVEEDLIQALQSQHLGGAYLDVFQQEPLPEASPLWEMDNVVITPHNAGPTPHYEERAFAIFLDNLKRFEKGQELVNLVDYTKGY